MFMSINSFFGDVILIDDIIPKNGGQCSFYFELPKIKSFNKKRSVRLDTTTIYLVGEL